MNSFLFNTFQGSFVLGLIITAINRLTDTKAVVINSNRVILKSDLLKLSSKMLEYLECNIITLAVTPVTVKFELTVVFHPSPSNIKSSLNRMLKSPISGLTPKSKLCSSFP